MAFMQYVEQHPVATVFIVIGFLLLLVAIREKKKKKRYGRRATERQIMFAQNVAKLNNVPEPKHLYDHHISLAAWTWGQGFGR